MSFQQLKFLKMKFVNVGQQTRLARGVHDFSAPLVAPGRKTWPGTGQIRAVIDPELEQFTLHHVGSRNLLVVWPKSLSISPSLCSSSKSKSCSRWALASILPGSRWIHLPKVRRQRVTISRSSRVERSSPFSTMLLAMPRAVTLHMRKASSTRLVWWRSLAISRKAVTLSTDQSISSMPQ